MHDRDANHRIWFTAVTKALGESALSIESSSIEHVFANLSHASVLIVMYKDKVALEAVKNITRGSSTKLKAIVIASDMYGPKDYVEWSPYASLFIAPSEEHKILLQNIVRNDIVVIEEPVDPISMKSVQKFSIKFDGWLTWFGYPESFYKGMQYIIPILAEAVNKNHIQGLKIITSGRVSDSAPPWISHITYSEATLAAELSGACFSILSHNPYDFHYNSFIKTDNKALLSLALGTIPICSDTPSYGKLLRLTKLECFLFKSIRDLELILSELSLVDHERINYVQRININQVLEDRSAENTGKRLKMAAKEIIST